MDYIIAEVIRDAGTGEGIDYVPGAITGWEVRLLTDRGYAEVDYEYVVLDATGFSIETVGVQDDGSGEPELFEDPAKVTAKADEAAIAQRLERIAFGQRIIGIMSIRNDAKGLDQAQLETLLATYDVINKMLINGSVATARAMIADITPDGTITTAADQTALLAEIDANLTALGYA